MDGMMRPEAFRAELAGNILPYWLRYAPDEARGGFHGERDGQNAILPDSPRSSVLCSRILWTFASAYRLLGEKAYLDMARCAYTYLTGPMWDVEHGGVYAMVDPNGTPLTREKRLFSQAFAIFALSEYHRTTGHTQALDTAKRLYGLIEEHATDRAFGGYHETLDRAWGVLHGSKSTDAHMHIIEAYTNLLVVWDNAELRSRLAYLVELVIEKAISKESGHMLLTFDGTWKRVSEEVAFGQDIENSWLLCVAAERVGEPCLLEKARAAALGLVAAVAEVDDGKGMPYGWTPKHGVDTDRCWWVQSEAVLGYMNAFAITGQQKYYEAANSVWHFIRTHMLDKTYGDWYCRVDAKNRPRMDKPKISAWKCPYHNARMCIVMSSNVCGA